MQVVQPGVVPNSVSTADIQNGAVTNPKIANLAVTGGKVASGSLTSLQMDNTSVPTIVGYEHGNNVTNNVPTTGFITNPTGRVLRISEYYVLHNASGTPINGNITIQFTQNGVLYTYSTVGGSRSTVGNSFFQGGLTCVPDPGTSVSYAVNMSLGAGDSVDYALSAVYE